MIAVYKKELFSYFITPIGYVFTAMFLLISGVLFSMFTLYAAENSDINSYFFYLVAIFAVLLPLLTMKSLSDERKTKTEQLLLTSPVSLFSMVFGKYLAALTVFGCSLAVNSLSFFFLYKYGSPNGAALASNILALFLIGSSFLAVGIFLSSFTENQFVAAVTSIASTVFMLSLYYIGMKINTEWLRVFVMWFSVYDRYRAFSGGFLDITAIIYFISFAAVFLFLTVRVYERRRWA